MLPLYYQMFSWLDDIPFVESLFRRVAEDVDAIVDLFFEAVLGRESESVCL